MLFEAPQRPLPSKMSLATLSFQVFLYYDSIYTMVLLPFQLFLFIYKYNSFPYKGTLIAVEVILLIVAFFLNWARLHEGRTANKGKKIGRYCLYLLFTVVIIVGFLYLAIWQRYVYWLEFIIHVIAMIIVGIELIASLAAIITYQLSD
jgi:hypothetical protein